MALQITPLTRIFLYAGMTLPDPSPTSTPQEVRDLYAEATYPELATASVEGPRMVNGQQEFTLVRAARDKG